MTPFNHNSFGDALRAARIAADLSQTEAAGRAGLKQSNWSKYENGEHIPSIRKANRMAQAIGVSLHELIPM